MGYVMLIPLQFERLTMAVSPSSKPPPKPTPQPDTLAGIMAMFQTATFTSTATTKEEDGITAFEMALAAENVDKSLIM